ncbi:hypothetical protein [Nocardioides sp. GXQ0305]|uniref:hypothetical protein n=1 Tax=Nocardioides sp. GXQ0305 TaxID=3423912 RepID=UPI003D7DA410
MEIGRIGHAVAGALFAETLMSAALSGITAVIDLPGLSSVWATFLPLDLVVRALRTLFVRCTRTDGHHTTHHETTSRKDLTMYDRHNDRIHPVRRRLATLAGLTTLVLTTAGALGAAPAGATAGAVERGATTASVASVRAEATAADAALARTVKRIGLRRYEQAVVSLTGARTHTVRANNQARSLIGAPPTDPESDDPPGPPAVLAALRLDYRMSTGTVALFDGQSNADVIAALRSTLSSAQHRRDVVLADVVALPAEGDGADYGDGMADTLAIYDREVTAISNALDHHSLTAASRTGLSNALARAQATRDVVQAAFGGGER